jgi:hypothetical protein
MFSPYGVPPRRNEELLCSHLLHLQANKESAPIPPTAETAITQRMKIRKPQTFTNKDKTGSTLSTQYFNLGKL